MNNDVECLLTCIPATHVSPLESTIQILFLLDWILLLLSCKISLYIPDRNSLSYICVVNIETNFWPLEITGNLVIVVGSVHK